MLERLLGHYVDVGHVDMGPMLEELCKKEGGDKMDELVALSVVNTVWERLDEMKSSRESLGSYQSLIIYDGEFCGLVEQLLRDMSLRLCTIMQVGCGPCLGVAWAGRGQPAPAPPWTV